MSGQLRVLITGSRTWTDEATIHNALLAAWTEAIEADYDGITVIHGGAAGADTIAARWADQNRRDGVGVECHDADWAGPCAADCPPGHRRKQGSREWCPLAGHRRNQAMVDSGPAFVCAFSVGNSTGTADCVRRAKAAGLLVRKWTA